MSFFAGESCRTSQKRQPVQAHHQFIQAIVFWIRTGLKKREMTLNRVFDSHGQSSIPVAWCPWRDLNPHSFRKRILSPPRLPFHHTGVCDATL